MDLQRSPRYCSPPAAHKPITDISGGTAPVSEEVEAPLDLSTKPRPTDTDAPLDLTVTRPGQLTGQSDRREAKHAPPQKAAVNDTGDDDVIVVGVQQGRKFVPPATHHIPMRRSKHDLRQQMLTMTKADIMRQFPSGVSQQQAMSGDKAKALFSMCKKETYTGGVAYSPFDLNTGLMRLKQMLMMARDPQQAKQLAHSFQKMALTALLKSRLQQQQRAAGNVDRSNSPQRVGPASAAVGTPPSSVMSTPPPALLIRQHGTSPVAASGTAPVVIDTLPVSVGTSPMTILTSTTVGTSPITVGTPSITVGTSPLTVGTSPPTVGTSSMASPVTLRTSTPLGKVVTSPVAIPLSSSSPSLTVTEGQSSVPAMLPAMRTGVSPPTGETSSSGFGISALSISGEASPASLSAQPLGSPPMSVGTSSISLAAVTDSYNANTDIPPHRQTFIPSQLSLGFDPTSNSSMKHSGDSPSVSTTRAASGSPVASPAVNRGTSDSPAGNFESEYMKYVRSKRFMSGGSDITAEKQGSLTPPQLQTAQAKRGDGSGRKPTRQSFTDYQYIINEINKVTKSALQMAENMYRKKHGLPVLDGKVMTPPPAHSKVNVSRVDPKKPHLNMFKGHQRMMMQRTSTHNKGAHKQGHKNLVTHIKPEDLPGFVPQASKAAAPEMPPLQPLFYSSSPDGKVGSIQQRGRTWTPPVGGPELFGKPTVGQMPGKGSEVTVDLTRPQPIKEAAWSHQTYGSPQDMYNKGDKPLLQQTSTDFASGDGTNNILRIPKYHSNDDAQEMMSAYGEGGSKGVDGKQQEAGSVYDKDQSTYEIPNVKPIEITPESPEIGGPNQPVQITPKCDGSGTVAYQSSRCLSGGTVSTPTLIAGGSATDLITHGRHHQLNPPFPCMSPNGSTVVKPVTSTFIGWNVSGYKRIPVANVNPIKVKGGEQQQYLDVPTINSASQQLPLVGQPPVFNIAESTPANLINRSHPNDSKEDQYIPMQQEQTVQFAHQDHQRHYRPPNMLANDPKPRTLSSHSSNSSSVDKTSTSTQHNDAGKSGPSIQHSSIPSNASFEIPIIQGRPLGIMATPTTLKAQRKASKDETKQKKPKKVKIPKVTKDTEQQDSVSKERTKLKIKSGKVTKVKTSKSVESKTEAIKAILRGGMSLLPSYNNVTVDTHSEDMVGKTGKKKNKEKGKGVNFHSSDDELEATAEKEATKEPAESLQEAADGVVERKKPGRKKKKRKADILTKPVKAKRIKKGTEDTEAQGGFSEDVQQQQVRKWGTQQGQKPKIKGKKRGRKPKDNRSGGYRVTGLYTYNKNAKYEEELVREEERKLLLRVRRQARRSTTTSQEENGENEWSKDGSYCSSDVTGDTFSIMQNTALDYYNNAELVNAAPLQLDSTVLPEQTRNPLKRKKLMPGKVPRIWKRRKNTSDLEPLDRLLVANTAESLQSADGKKLRKRRRKRWYKRRKPLDYVHYMNEYCMGEVDEGELNEASEFVLPVPDLDFDLQLPCVDPVLLAELKGIVVCRETGETKLHRLTRMGHEDLAVRCIEAGVFDVNGCDHAGYTALHESCVTGRLKVAKALLANGANVDAAALDGTRPLHDAVDHHRLELVRLLLSCGADPRTSTYSGKTPMKIARMPDMKELLTGHLQDINGPQSGDTTQHWTFSLTSQQKPCDQLGFDMLSNLPTDNESEAEEVGFEFWETDPLHFYHICLDTEVGPRNYYLLLDIAQLKDMPKEDFKLINFDLVYKSLYKQEALEICELYFPISKDKIEFLYRDNEQVEFVESNALLQSILEVETVVVSVKDMVEYGHLHDVSFTETPIDRTVCDSEGSQVLSKGEADGESQSIKSCSRKLMFSQDQPQNCSEESTLGNTNNHNKTNLNLKSTKTPNCDPPSMLDTSVRSASIDEPLPVLEKVITPGLESEESKGDEAKEEGENKQQKANDDMPCLTLCV